MLDRESTIPEDAETVEKRRTLENLAMSFGVTEVTAKLTAAGLLAAPELVADIDYEKDKHDQAPDDIKKIESIGMWFLSGNEHPERYCYAVGCRVIAMLRVAPTSKIYTSLEDYVGMWTSGSRNQIFKQLMKGKKAS